MKPRILDLYCGAGGAAEGYRRAGFEVWGVDLHFQLHYPFAFTQKDALAALHVLVAGEKLHFEQPYGYLTLDDIDGFHASPPCQRFSVMSKAHNGRASEHPDLVGRTRILLEQTRKPYVIENVMGSPLEDPIRLCGTMFPPLRVLRHRLFETTFPVPEPPHRRHPLVYTMDKRKAHYGLLDETRAFVQVTGGGNCSVAAAKDAMGIDWMTKKELNEAIPPAYTEYIGRHLLTHLNG